MIVPGNSIINFPPTTTCTTQQELEAIEEQWRSESNDLMTMVSRLQDENRRILKQHSSSAESAAPSPDASPRINCGEHRTPSSGLRRTSSGDDASGQQATSDVQVVQRLRAQLEKFRNELRLKEIDLQAKTADADNVSESQK